MATGRVPTTANSPLTAKGDLFTYSTAPARLAVGTNGDSLVADSSTATGLSYQENYAAGKNKIINGDFNINQRAFTSTTTTGTFLFDRFNASNVDGTCTYSAQTFTAGTAPVVGYESTNFIRLVSTGQTLTNAEMKLQHRIESVRTLAGQTATISFWAKASTGTPSVAVELVQAFGSGGSSAVTGIGAAKSAITSSWSRYSFTVSVTSISGKTLGVGNYLALNIYTSAGSDFNARTNSLGIQSVTIELWGVQLEAGSVATAFQTATGTLQGELAACQRYFQSLNGSLSGYSATGTNTANYYRHLVQTRVTPTVTVTTAPTYTNASGLTNDENSVTGSRFYMTVTAANQGFAVGFIYSLSAEL